MTTLVNSNLAHLNKVKNAEFIDLKLDVAATTATAFMRQQGIILPGRNYVPTKSDVVAYLNESLAEAIAQLEIIRDEKIGPWNRADEALRVWTPEMDLEGYSYRAPFEVAVHSNTADEPGIYDVEISLVLV